MTISNPEVYQGQFGEFTINQNDRQEVIIYRTGLMVAAICFAVGTYLALQYNNPTVWRTLTWLYAGFSIF